MITGIVLGADAGRQLGGPKAELLLAGERLIDRAVFTLRAGGCDEALTVVGSDEVQVVGARVVIDADPNPDAGSSLRLALASLHPDTEAVLITRVDLPGVLPTEVKAALGWYRNGASIIITRRGGERSHPILISRRWLRPFAQSVQSDQGGIPAFFAANYEEIDFLDYAEPLADINTPEDLDAAQRRFS